MSGAHNFVGRPVIRAAGEAPPAMSADEKPAKPIPPVLARRRAEYVREHIAIVRRMLAEGTDRPAIFEAVPLFAEGFPGLFKSLLENDPRTNAYIEQTLVMLDRMASEELTQHQASALVGTLAYNAHIKPVVQNLDRSN
jgi:hypothetical protein